MTPQRLSKRRAAVGTAAGVVVVLGAAVMFLDPLEQKPLLSDGFEGQGAAGTPVDPCAHPLVAPAGWELKEKSWRAAFSSPNGLLKPTYPNGLGTPVPIPGSEFRKGQIVSIPFVALPETTVDMTWDGVQAQPNYPPRPADLMFVGISPCRADLRTDPRCSRAAGMDSLFYTTRQASGAACRLTAGGSYFLNFVMANPSDGLEPGEHTCSTTAPNSVNGCDVQMRHTAY